MSKPKNIPVPQPHGSGGERKKEHHSSSTQEPLSGSKKVKQANHVDHHNPQG